MISRGTFLVFGVGALLVTGAIVIPQWSRAAEEPGEALVSIYRVAPGKHLEFLKWQAAREAIDKEAGVPAAQWYVHADGDSWDFVVIAPAVSDAQEDKVEELAKKKGLTTGFKASLEFRKFVSSHTDTFALGPTTAAQLVQQAESN